MSAKSEPVIWEKRVLRSMESGRGMVRVPASTSAMVKREVGGFGDGPDDGVGLAGGDEALGGGGESLGHAEGEAEVVGEGEARLGAEECAGDGIEDGGVDEAFAGA